MNSKTKDQKIADLQSKVRALEAKYDTLSAIAVMHNETFSHLISVVEAMTATIESNNKNRSHYGRK